MDEEMTYDWFLFGQVCAVLMVIMLVAMCVNKFGEKKRQACSQWFCILGTDVVLVLWSGMYCGQGFAHTVGTDHIVPVLMVVLIVLSVLCSCLDEEDLGEEDLGEKRMLFLYTCTVILAVAAAVYSYYISPDKNAAAQGIEKIDSDEKAAEVAKKKATAAFRAEQWAAVKAEAWGLLHQDVDDQIHSAFGDPPAA